MGTPGKVPHSQIAVAEKPALSLPAELTKVLLAALAAPLAVQLLSRPLRMPGHSIVFWFVPLALGASLSRLRVRGMGMGVVAGLVAMVFAKKHAGLCLAEYVVAGAVLDAFMARRFDRGAVSTMVFWTACGLSANLAKLAIKMATFFLPRTHLRLTPARLPGVLASYIIFGLMAGAFAGLIFVVAKRVSKSREISSPSSADVQRSPAEAVFPERT